MQGEVQVDRMGMGAGQDMARSLRKRARTYVRTYEATRMRKTRSTVRYTLCIYGGYSMAW